MRCRRERLRASLSQPRLTFSVRASTAKILARPPAAVGLLSASNAAADPTTISRRTAPGAHASAPIEQNRSSQASLARPCRRSTHPWQAVLEALDLTLSNDGPPIWDAEDTSLEPFEAEDRREVLEVLVHGTPEGMTGLGLTLENAARDDGRYVPQVVLLRGKLVFPFDGLETLRASVAAAAPFVTDSEDALKTAVATAREFLKTADDLTPAPVIAGMATRIKEAFKPDKRSMPETYLDDQTDRVLLEAASVRQAHRLRRRPSAMPRRPRRRRRASGRVPPAGPRQPPSLVRNVQGTAYRPGSPTRGPDEKSPNRAAGTSVSAQHRAGGSPLITLSARPRAPPRWQKPPYLPQFLRTDRAHPPRPQRARRPVPPRLRALPHGCQRQEPRSARGS